MPLKISDVGKILKALNRFEGIGEFNTSLPIKVEIKKQLNELNYLINLGNKKDLITKSKVKLFPGKYFASIKELNGFIQIKDLKPIPKLAVLLEKINFEFKEKNLEKTSILHYLANASSKEEFLFFTNILLAMQKKIYHYFINKKKKALLQYKFNKNKLKFYAVFNNLGEIEGEIFLNSVNIYSPYKEVLKLINENSNQINLKVNTFLKKDIKPLFEFNENLINLKA